ncbi:hypothetical protein CKK33_06890 [Mucilaginibacter sp. MD40]|uniref:hypothetical protein n=1 Tax=Mucilaginibacter sp. MD40 TaxID=2029590 RepID=UPI000BAC6153|nr:hypothetical protein [Mucilaginibacter sp. MD40]PAW93238.1 hypothetical protein CKK33_06890 [Mucilaginibacter sp. MD40]
MIQQYINSGILEAYVTGSASEKEVEELMRMKTEYPEVSRALQELEADMEHLARHMAVEPPARTWDKISDSIDEIMLRNKHVQPFIEKEEANPRSTGRDNGQQYIEVEAESSFMRIHKAWKWVFAAVFILGKVFLACAIYFYLENRQAQQQLQEIKTELRKIKP